jgi:hypothetical protein
MNKEKNEMKYFTQKTKPEKFLLFFLRKSNVLVKKTTFLISYLSLFFCILSNEILDNSTINKKCPLQLSNRHFIQLKLTKLWLKLYVHY